MQELKAAQRAIHVVLGNYLVDPIHIWTTAHVPTERLATECLVLAVASTYHAVWMAGTVLSSFSPVRMGAYVGTVARERNTGPGGPEQGNRYLSVRVRKLRGFPAGHQLRDER
jgi:hypothetical protein